MPKNRIATVLAAPTIALLGWTVARLLGIDLVTDTQTVGPVDVAAAALVAALAGSGVVTYLERRSPRPQRAWALIGSTALSISMIGPSWLADGATAAALIALHVAVAVVVIVGFARTLPRDCRCGPLTA
jgi:Family of unknown function (DUF6069)